MSFIEFDEQFLFIKFEDSNFLKIKSNPHERLLYRPVSIRLKEKETKHHGPSHNSHRGSGDRHAHLRYRASLSSQCLHPINV
jgi:hypothetical protein